MTQFLVLLISFALGLVSQRLHRFPKSSGVSINQFIILVSLPALILAKFPPLIHSLELTGYWWVPVSMAWLSFIFCWILVSALGRYWGWSSPKTGALILTAGLGNTSYVGFPLLEALIGPEAIPIGILADQPGSFLVVSTLGLFVAAKMGGGSVSLSMASRRILLFPPFIALLVAALWSVLHIESWLLLLPAFDKISLTLVPLALFAVGFQSHIKWPVLVRRRLPLTVGLSLKLIILPFLCLILYDSLLGIRNEYSRVAILEAAMATQITSAIVAADFNLDTELANLMVSLSIPLSLLSVPIWHYLI